MRTRTVAAARPDGRLARYCVYPGMAPPLAVDCERALAALDLLSTFNAYYKWVIYGARAVGAAVLVAGAVTLPRLFVAIVGSWLAYALYRALPETAADFVQDVRVAARGLMRDRMFSVFAIVTLALGIGATVRVGRRQPDGRIEDIKKRRGLYGNCSRLPRDLSSRPESG